MRGDFDEDELDDVSAGCIESDNHPATKPMLPWQRKRYGDREGARLALAYYRARNWPVDDFMTTGVDERIYAYIHAYEAGCASRDFARLGDGKPPADDQSTTRNGLQRIRELVSGHFDDGCPECREAIAIIDDLGPQDGRK